MKRLLLSLLAVGAMTAAQAQINTPAASPKGMTMQTVGLTDVSVEYNRPSAKGRTIFGADGLVPYGKVWRTGANSVSKLSTSGPITIGGKDLAGGDYAMLSIPGQDMWKVHFYTYGSSSYSSYLEAEPAAIIDVKPVTTKNTVEDFTLEFKNMKGGNADLVLQWERTVVSMPITTDVDGVVMKSIDRVMAGPSPGDYYAAASYYHESGKDLNKALEMITVATDIPEPKFWQVRRKALILADLGKTADAIKAAEMSKELAMAAGNEDYVKLNEKSIAEWKK